MGYLSLYSTVVAYTTAILVTYVSAICYCRYPLCLSARLYLEAARLLMCEIARIAVQLLSVAPPAKTLSWPLLGQIDGCLCWLLRWLQEHPCQNATGPSEIWYETKLALGFLCIRSG